MSTTNYGLVQPVDGSDGWGGDMNNNLESIDGQMFSNAEAVASHIGGGSNKHRANQIETTAGSDVETQLGLRSLSGHNHNSTEIFHGSEGGNTLSTILISMLARLDSLEATMALLLPDVSSVVLIGTPFTSGAGITVVITSEGDILLQGIFEVEYSLNAFHSDPQIISSSSPSVHIPADSRWVNNQVVYYRMKFTNSISTTGWTTWRSYSSNYGGAGS